MRSQDEAFEARMYHVRTTCLSRGKPVRSTAVVVVNDLPEADEYERIFIVHDGCQTA